MSSGSRPAPGCTRPPHPPILSNLAFLNLLFSRSPPGAGHGPGARFACRVCLVLGLAAPLVASGGLLAAPRAWAALYTPDRTVIDLGAWGACGAACGACGHWQAWVHPYTQYSVKTVRHNTTQHTNCLPLVPASPRCGSLSRVCPDTRCSHSPSPTCGRASRCIRFDHLTTFPPVSHARSRGADARAVCVQRGGQHSRGAQRRAAGRRQAGAGVQGQPRGECHIQAERSILGLCSCACIIVGIPVPYRYVAEGQAYGSESWLGGQMQMGAGVEGQAG